jgi:hypothetical protein
MDNAVPVQDEFSVNQTGGMSKVAGLANGNFVVTYQGASSPTVNGIVFGGIAAQLFSASGNRIGSEFFVSQTPARQHYTPDVTALTGGGFVITWLDDVAPQGSARTDIKAQIFSDTGVRLGAEFLVSNETLAGQGAPDIIQLADGGFLVTWFDDSRTLGDNSFLSVKARLFGPDGSPRGNEFLVNTQTFLSQGSPAATQLTNNNIVITWTDQSQIGSDNDETGIKGQIFDSNGRKIGNEFLVNTQTFGTQGPSEIAALANGDFVVTWQDRNEQLGNFGRLTIKAQLFNSEGAKKGVEFVVNTERFGGQYSPDIISLPNGGFLITWEDASRTLGDADSTSIKAQAFDGNGAKIGGEFLVNTVTAGFQQRPSIAALADGGLVIAWDNQPLDNSPGNVRAQIYNFGGASVSRAEELVLFLPGTRDLISWDSTQGSSGFTYFFRLNAGTDVATVADFTGDGRPDVLLSQPGGGLIRWDTALGGAGFVALPATPGFDVIATGDLVGGSGADLLLQNTAGQLRIMDGSSGTITDLFGLASGWSVAGVANINGTGKADVVLKNSGSGAVIAFTDQGWRDLITLGSGWEIAGLGDVTGGLADDFILQRNDGVTIFWDSTQGGNGFRDFATIGPAWNFAGFNDLNGDDRDDVVLQNDNGLAIYWTGSNWVDLGSTLIGTELVGTGVFP